MCEYLYFDNDKWLIFVKNAYLCTTKQGCKVFTRDKCSAAFVRFPMAANIQLVFYRNPKKPKADLLVKALLNEEEATMPLPATSTPFYYRWTDFKKFYLARLNAYNQ